MATLTADQIAIIKSTVPIIREHGTTVTTTFYANMLAAHPELKNYFSLRNQQTGAQQAALANSADAKHSNLTTKIFLNNVSESDVKGQQYDYAGRVNLDTLEADGVLPLNDASAEYYICGPEEWMVQVRAELLKKGVSLDRQHLELFRTGTI
ncbi:hypothetical protein M440DRAFT_1394523 [Trichoderma longibrachiatum ATCC 18648]|uniref:Globin domain-containing protein n=1 Tax=Trichoderma longibrachiatum ATCC 18648 TaxID=983965 RepID=A0A2T4BTP2_TRILO|nr:hypothetical protein M440DRAFT_1394523 [Trichoderma longibrachiatum ATCC 18648]